MPKRMIAKIIFFVIPAMVSAACGHIATGDRRPAIDQAASAYEKPAVIARLESQEVDESSGLVASRCQENVFWTHNDSGDDAFIYAFDASGQNLGTWRVQGARNDDWEDIASFTDSTGNCLLYIGEIGNTNENRRLEHKIYRIREPRIEPAHVGTSRKNPLVTEPAEVLSFTYPDRAQDAETLLVHPQTGDIYLLTKDRSLPSGVYRLRPQFGSAAKAEKLADVSVPAVPNGYLTGGDISPDGSRVVLCDYSAAYELILPAGAASFDSIWSQRPTPIDLGERMQGEAVSYAAEGRSIFATSEKKRPPLIQAKRKQ
jgi:hypothetical protein